MHASADAQVHNARRPEQTLLYRTVVEQFETWLELARSGQFDGQCHHTPAAYVEQAFRKYLECVIFAHGFARARCGDCAHDFLIAFLCKGCGVCPSCTTRRMAETAAHLADHVFSRLPVCQWVLSVPKSPRYFVQREGADLNTALRILLRVVQHSLVGHCTGPARSGKAALCVGAVAFIHRFSYDIT